jgi:alpha-1,2-mannosyltransferase
MSFLATCVVTVLALLAASFVLPTVTGYALSYVLRGIGWSIKNKTKGRRELILTRALIEEEEFRSKENKSSNGGAEDEDWEKVDNSILGTAGNGEPLGDEWEGIIGFFHPFW